MSTGQNAALISELAHHSLKHSPRTPESEDSSSNNLKPSTVVETSGTASTQHLDVPVAVSNNSIPSPKGGASERKSILRGSFLFRKSSNFGEGSSASSSSSSTTSPHLSVSPRSSAESTDSSSTSSAPDIRVELLSFTVVRPKTSKGKSKGKAFAVYNVRVKRGHEEWSIERRYSHFQHLHKQLQKSFPSHKFIHFPRKRIKGNLEPLLLEKRRRKITNYMKDILSNPQIASSSLIASFISESSLEVTEESISDDGEDISTETDTVTENSEPPRIEMLFDFPGTAETDISCNAGEEMILLQPDDGSGWCFVQRTSDGKQGYVPSTYIRMIERNTSPDVQKTFETSTDAARAILRWWRTRHFLRKLEGARQSLQERLRVIGEILETEQIYGENLDILVKVFYKPLKDRAEDKTLSRPPLSKKSVSIIFAHIEAIHSVNKSMLKSLQEAVDFHDAASLADESAADRRKRLLKPKNQKQFCSALLRTIPFLKLYIEYVNNFEASASRLARKIAKNGALTAFLKEMRKNERLKGRSMQDLLIMPVQRLPRLQLLVERLVNFTPNISVAYNDLVNALESIKSINELINVRKRQQDELKRITGVEAEKSRRFSSERSSQITIPIVVTNEDAPVSTSGMNILEGRLQIIQHSATGTREIIMGGAKQNWFQCRLTSRFLFYRSPNSKGPEMCIILHLCELVDDSSESDMSFQLRASLAIGANGDILEDQVFDILAVSPQEKKKLLDELRHKTSVSLVPIPKTLPVLLTAKELLREIRMSAKRAFDLVPDEKSGEEASEQEVSQERESNRPILTTLMTNVRNLSSSTRKFQEAEENEAEIRHLVSETRSNLVLLAHRIQTRKHKCQELQQLFAQSLDVESQALISALGSHIRQISRCEEEFKRELALVNPQSSFSDLDEGFDQILKKIVGGMSNHKLLDDIRGITSIVGTMQNVMNAEADTSATDLLANHELMIQFAGISQNDAPELKGLGPLVSTLDLQIAISALGRKSVSLAQSLEATTRTLHHTQRNLEQEQQRLAQERQLREEQAKQHQESMKEMQRLLEETRAQNDHLREKEREIALLRMQLSNKSAVEEATSPSSPASPSISISSPDVSSSRLRKPPPPPPPSKDAKHAQRSGSTASSPNVQQEAMHQSQLMTLMNELKRLKQKIQQNADPKSKDLGFADTETKQLCQQNKLLSEQVAGLYSNLEQLSERLVQTEQALSKKESTIEDLLERRVETELQLARLAYENALLRSSPAVSAHSVLKILDNEKSLLV